MASKYSYKFAPLAASDLSGTLDYIEQKLCNPKAAEDFAINLFKGIDAVIEFPASGLNVDNEYITDQTLRRFIIGNYIVFYKIDEINKTVIIVRIVYGGRDMNEILKTI